MKINVGINEDDKKIMFVTDDKGDNIGEMEVSEGYYEHSLREFTGNEGNMGIVSDGSHTFNELYYHRMALFSIICNQNKEFAWKSWKHDDGSMFEDYFIVGITTRNGDYSYHYHKNHWNKFNVKELENAPKWDGHLPKDVIRLTALLDVEKYPLDNKEWK